MNRDAQIYWIIDIIISMAMTAIIFQPIQAAFCKFFDFNFYFFFFFQLNQIYFKIVAILRAIRTDSAKRIIQKDLYYNVVGI